MKYRDNSHNPAQGFFQPMHLNRYQIIGWFFFLFAFILPGAVEAQEGCHPNLAHHYGLNEQQGNTYKDNIRGVDATCTDCPTPATGIFGGAQSFDGSNDGLTISNTAAFEWGPNSSFAIELWVKTSAKPSDNQIMIGRKAKENGMVWWVGMDKEGRAVFALWDNRGNVGANIGYGDRKINDGKWHHILVVRDGIDNENRIYVDGLTTGVSKYKYDGGYFDKSASPVTIGRLELGNGYHFKGEIDEVMVYRNYALTEKEARARYNNGNGNFCGNEQAAPIIMSEPVTYGTIGQQYKYDVQATGAPAPTYSVTGAPAGLTINVTTGLIVWEPTEAGAYNISVKATNSVGEAEQPFTIVIKKSIGNQTGLLHHWMMHEFSGTEYKDYYTPHHARSVGDTRPEPVTGVVSGGQRFNGQNELDVIGSRNFDWQPDESFTIELWMRTDISKSSNRVLIGRQGKPESEPPVHWWLGIDKNGQALFNLRDYKYEGTHIGQTGPRLDDGVWHQVVAVRDGKAGVTRLYVDGEEISTGSFTHSYGFSIRSNVNIGYLDGQDPSTGGYRYEGDLDEVKLFGRPLSADEIRQNYNDVFNAIMDLVKFEGVYRNGVVVLDWETLNEVNCESFTVERSADMENFEAIGEVAGAGNSTQLLAYSFTDKEPLAQDAYYRLKINRTDGTYTYSNIILIAHKGLNTVTFKVYPNPLTQQSAQEVTVVIENMAPEEDIIFFVSDMAGKRIMEQELKVESDGRLTFTIPVTVTGNLRSGMYMLTVATNLRNITRKLIVVQ